jgi:hypothetical protein
MMGILMPETCWAVSVRQGNNILWLIVASGWLFYLNIWGGEMYSLWSSLRCSLLRFPVTPSFLGPSIFLATLFCILHNCKLNTEQRNNQPSRVLNNSAEQSSFRDVNAPSSSQ